jgi:uncharacterized damage-inducible protein DinB
MPVDSVVSESPVALLFPDLAEELVITRTLLALAPGDKFDWAPHARSMTLGQLTSHVAGLPALGAVIINVESLVFDLAHWVPKRLESTDAVLALFDAESAKLHAALETLDWDKLNFTWQMTMGGHVALSGLRRVLLRKLAINHLVHHRAQLGVYLRLLDIKLPGSYGPSADSR